MLGKAMRGVVIHFARIVGGGAGSPVTVAQQSPPHKLPQLRASRCTVTVGHFRRHALYDAGDGVQYDRRKGCGWRHQAAASSCRSRPTGP